MRSKHDGGKLRRRNRARREHQALVAAVLRLMKRLERRRGRAEHDRYTALPCAPDGDVAAVVAHAFLLLERRIVFFVDDDEAESRHRCEYREPRAEHEIRLACGSCFPMTTSQRGGKPTVQRHRPPPRKCARYPLQELGGQVDFRDQQQRLTAGRHASRRGGEIHLGLAAPGDAVEHERRESAERVRNGRDGALLFGVECRGGGGRRNICRKRGRRKDAVRARDAASPDRRDNLR